MSNGTGRRCESPWSAYRAGRRSRSIPGASTVFVPSGVELDFGATAKGLCADRAARAIGAATRAGVLVSLGGDISIGGPERDDGWVVLVSDDHAGSPDAVERDALGSRIAVRSGGVATSGTTVRRWRRGEIELHHVVDPRTGAPATEHWRTVSVAAASCVDANIASTALAGDGCGCSRVARSLQAPRPPCRARRNRRDRRRMARGSRDLVLAAATNSKAIWYLTRGTGMVSLVLLTASVALGIAEVVRFATPRWPRFVVAALHRNISLLATAFLAVHIITAVADSFAPIRIVDVFVPFVGTYRPLWLGLGAVGLDLLLALVISSLLRERIGYKAWRAVHWAAYACWPVALLHGLGTGSDTRVRWAVFINVGVPRRGRGGDMGAGGLDSHRIFRTARACRARDHDDRASVSSRGWWPSRCDRAGPARPEHRARCSLRARRQRCPRPRVRPRRRWRGSQFPSRARYAARSVRRARPPAARRS